MSEKSLKIAVVGAGTLLGKALSDELALSAFASADIRLLDDDEDVQGKLAAVDDEITLIQRIEPDSFDGCDFIFFACDPAITKKHLRQALKSGACIVDLSGELEKAPGVLVRAPWVPERPAGDATPGAGGAAKTPTPDLDTRAVVSAHPVAVLLAMLAARSQKVGPLHGLWATSVATSVRVWTRGAGRTASADGQSAFIPAAADGSFWRADRIYVSRIIRCRGTGGTFYGGRQNPSTLRENFFGSRIVTGAAGNPGSRVSRIRAVGVGRVSASSCGGRVGQGAGRIACAHRCGCHRVSRQCAGGGGAGGAGPGAAGVPAVGV